MPYERYTTIDDALPCYRGQPDAQLGRCTSCGEVYTVADVITGRMIRKRNGMTRHESCGGPPAANRPVKHASDLEAWRAAKRGGGKAGRASNGRVVRGTNNLGG